MQTESFCAGKSDLEPDVFFHAILPYFGNAVRPPREGRMAATADLRKLEVLTRESGDAEVLKVGKP